MIKKYLITNLCKLKFKKNSHLIFENEYLKKLNDVRNSLIDKNLTLDENVSAI